MSYRLKHLLQMQYGDALASEVRQPGDYIVFGSNGPVGEHNQINTDVPAIIVGRKGSYGKITWAKYGGFCIDTALYVDARSCRGDLRYAYYLLQTLKLDEASKDSAVPGLDRFEAHNRAIKEISLPTQRTIADFLDRETARIDQLIEKKQSMVRLLGEKLEIDTLSAVTSGLDPKSENSFHSGLEWIAHRPKNWSIVRLKHFFHENTQYSKDGQELLLSLRMKEGLVPHNEVSDKEANPSDLVNYKNVFEGQIVMNRMRAAIGLFGIADRAGIVSPDYSVFEVSQKAHAPYFLRLFKTKPMMNAFRLLSKGLGTGHSGFMRLNSDNFGRIHIAVPELDEQKLISKFVEGRVHQISQLIAKNEQSITLLQEYRSALITAAVTGQIDVASWRRRGNTERRLDAIETEATP